MGTGAGSRHPRTTHNLPLPTFRILRKGITIYEYSQVLSVAVLAYGAWLLRNRAVYAPLLAPSVLVDVGRIMIVMAVLSFVNACIAIYAILNELRCVIYSVMDTPAKHCLLHNSGDNGFMMHVQLQ